MSVWVPVEVLEHWAITYVGVEQRPGELVVTALGPYYKGWNAAWNVAEAVNYGDGASATRVRGYRYCRQSCGTPATPIWPEAAAEGSSDAERQTGLRIWKVPEDSVFRAKVAEAIGVEDLLLPDRPA